MSPYEAKAKGKKRSRRKKKMNIKNGIKKSSVLFKTEKKKKKRENVEKSDLRDATATIA